MLRLLLPALLLLGCAAEQARDEIDYREPQELLEGEAQFEQLCSLPNRDLVIDIFCADERPEITSLVELREVLGLGTETTVLDRGFVLTGHSTSLVHRSVSSINPRIVFVAFDPVYDDLVAMAFARGERFSEIVVRSHVDREFQFYLTTFELPCDRSEEGCLPGDTLTEATESGWVSFNVYSEEELQNTPLDCRVCHQPEGPGTRKILRMQELEPPWNHWFYRVTRGGRALLDDYTAAKGDETFAGVPGPDIWGSQPALLSFPIFVTSPPQPYPYVSNVIESEVVRSAAAQGGAQPEDNSVPGESETWNALYERNKRGEVITVPYHDVKVTDPDKLALMTEAYAEYRAGTLPREELPDIREVFPDDERLQARMGFLTEPGMSGEQVLLQACATCHNDKLDQSLSRARFNVDLDSLDDEEKQRAIRRIQLPRDDPSAMPPPLSRQLSEEGRQRLIELLER